MDSRNKFAKILSVKNLKWACSTIIIFSWIYWLHRWRTVAPNGSEYQAATSEHDFDFHSNINTQLVLHESQHQHVPLKKTISWSDFTKSTGEKVDDLPYVDNRVEVVRSCPSHNAQASSACSWLFNTQYMSSWLQGRVKDQELFCEKGADSILDILESPRSPQSSRSGSGSGVRQTSLSRFFSFKNAMLNFKKMREHKGRREFEQSFLSAACGVSSAAEIDGLPLYYPDITDNGCDYTFPEPVLLVSRDSHVSNGGRVLRDSLMIFSALLLSGYASLERARHVTLLNVQGFTYSKRHSALHDSQEWKEASNYHYRKLFKRVLGAGDFIPGQRLCFKQLMILQKLPVQFPWLRNANTNLSCPPSINHGSELALRWNVQMRQLHHLLPTTHGSKFLPLVTNEILHVVLTMPTAAASRASHYRLAILHALEDLVLDLGKNSEYIQVSTVDFTDLPLAEQIYVAGNASILVGEVDKPALYAAAYMPLGTALCCGVLELGSPSQPHGSFASLAGFLGLHHASSPATSAQIVAEAVLEIARKLHRDPSCV